MLIDLNSDRVITYRINEVDNIDRIEYIVSFPSGYKHSFPVHIDRTTGECAINLPTLKDIIKIEFDGIGYIQITRPDGTRIELCKETVRFIIAEINDMNSNNTKEDITEPINSMALRTNEVVVSHSNTLQFIMSNINRNKK